MLPVDSDRVNNEKPSFPRILFKNNIGARNGCPIRLTVHKIDGWPYFRPMWNRRPPEAIHQIQQSAPYLSPPPWSSTRSDDSECRFETFLARSCQRNLLTKDLVRIYFFRKQAVHKLASDSGSPLLRCASKYKAVQCRECPKWLN